MSVIVCQRSPQSSHLVSVDDGIKITIWCKLLLNFSHKGFMKFDLHIIWFIHFSIRQFAVWQPLNEHQSYPQPPAQITPGTMMTVDWCKMDAEDADSSSSSTSQEHSYLSAAVIVEAAVDIVTMLHCPMSGP